MEISSRQAHWINQANLDHIVLVVHSARWFVLIHDFACHVLFQAPKDTVNFGGGYLWHPASATIED